MTIPHPQGHRWWLALLLATACGDDGTGPETTTAIGDPPGTTAVGDPPGTTVATTDTPPTSTGGDTTAGTGAGSDSSAGAGTVTLSVEVNGPGGTVTSDPPGIECGAGGVDDCTEDYPSGTQVTLSFTTAGAFVGWGGACSGTDAQCVLTLTEDTNVWADFAL